MIEINIHKKLRAAQGQLDLQAKFELEKGKIAALYGKSGGGKTSILRMIAGLMNPDSGTIQVNGVTWFDTKQINLKPQHRNTNMVFQDYALFPNMSVTENLLFANHSKQNANQLIEIMELGGIAHQKPHYLSGGQQQRVALARALMNPCELLLLDEPLSAVDNEIRIKLQDYVSEWTNEKGATVLWVSHDQSEITKMASKVIYLEDGNVTQCESVQNITPELNKLKVVEIVGEIVNIEAITDNSYQTSLKLGHSIVYSKVKAEIAMTLKVGMKVNLKDLE